MQRLLAVMAAIAVCCIAGLLYLGSGGGTTTSPAATAPDSDGARAPSPDAPEEISFEERGFESHPGPPATTRPATVRRLADGDSFDITWSDTGDRDEIRLFGINAPEGDACFGQDARSVLDTLIGGDELAVEVIQRDDFGRALGNVWVGDIFINATLIELGAALSLSDGGSHAQLLSAAQDRAASSKAGLWSPDTCGIASDVNVAIGWIEANAPGRDDENKNGEWIEIVNDGSTDADLSGWSIRDESTRHRYSFPNGFVLGAGDTVRVFSGCGDDRDDELYWCDADPVWNNGGDTGFLVDPDGRFVDTLSY